MRFILLLIFYGISSVTVAADLFEEAWADYKSWCKIDLAAAEPALSDKQYRPLLDYIDELQNRIETDRAKKEKFLQFAAITWSTGLKHGLRQGTAQEVDQLKTTIRNTLDAVKSRNGADKRVNLIKDMLAPVYKGIAGKTNQFNEVALLSIGEILNDNDSVDTTDLPQDPLRDTVGVVRFLDTTIHKWENYFNQIPSFTDFLTSKRDPLSPFRRPVDASVNQGKCTFAPLRVLGLTRLLHTNIKFATAEPETVLGVSLKPLREVPVPENEAIDTLELIRAGADANLFAKQQQKLEQQLAELQTTQDSEKKRLQEINESSDVADYLDFKRLQDLGTIAPNDYKILKDTFFIWSPRHELIKFIRQRLENTAIPMPSWDSRIKDDTWPTFAGDTNKYLDKLFTNLQAIGEMVREKSDLEGRIDTNDKQRANLKQQLDDIREKSTLTLMLKPPA